MKPILSTQKLSKRFGDLWANKDIDITIYPGEIHAIAGENGAGKSTLMKMLYGVYEPTSGSILVDSKVMQQWTPTLARENGVSMVFQDFRLVPAFTVLENIFISLRQSGWKINRKKLRRIILEKADEYQLSVDPDVEVWKLDLGQRQHVEILKILLSPRTRVMIFDEPTSVLAPHEIKAFLKMLSGFRDKGYGIFLITHKINEILAVADRITILRQGKAVSQFVKGESFSEADIISAMLGTSVDLSLRRPSLDECRFTQSVSIGLQNVSVKDDHNQIILRDMSFTIEPGEILGIAGISGNGQKELAEMLYGIRRIHGGKLLLNGKDITNTTISKRIEFGFRIVTEDPIRDNVIPNFTVLQNMALVGLQIETRRGDVDWQSMEKQLQGHTEIQNLGVPAPHRITGTLSGGNLQRMTFARAVISSPRFLIACYPSRGLDVATVNAVHQALFRLKKAGVTIVLISEDLSELLAMSDRLLILAGHSAKGPFPTNQCEPEEIGKIMLKGEVAKHG